MVCPDFIDFRQLFDALDPKENSSIEGVSGCTLFAYIQQIPIKLILLCLPDASVIPPLALFLLNCSISGVILYVMSDTSAV